MLDNEVRQQAGAGRTERFTVEAARVVVWSYLEAGAEFGVACEQMSRQILQNRLHIGRVTITYNASGPLATCREDLLCGWCRAKVESAADGLDWLASGVCGLDLAGPRELAPISLRIAVHHPRDLAPPVEHFLDRSQAEGLGGRRHRLLPFLIEPGPILRDKLGTHLRRSEVHRVRGTARLVCRDGGHAPNDTGPPRPKAAFDCFIHRQRPAIAGGRDFH